MGELNGKTIVVVGGGKTGGMGYGIASACARAGANLVVAGHNKGKLEAARELEAQGVRVLPLKVETDRAGIEAAVQRIREEFGRIDGLVIASQAAKSGTLLEDLKDADFELAFKMGPAACLAWMQSCLPFLREAEGSVILLGSSAALRGEVGQGPLAVAKEGLRGLARVAACEWATYGVNVNVICARADSAQFANLSEQYPEAAQEMLADIPMGRLADPQDEVGQTCVFLLSDAAAYISGQTIELSGAAGLHP